jgi:hypothetical protein
MNQSCSVFLFLFDLFVNIYKCCDSIKVCTWFDFESSIDLCEKFDVQHSNLPHSTNYTFVIISEIIEWRSIQWAYENTLSAVYLILALIVLPFTY